VSARPYPGYFIVLEGIDGSGSTTQAQRLVQHFTERGKVARFTCEPSVGHVGKLLRAAIERRLQDEGGSHRFDWATMALLFAADRLDHLATEVVPALDRGEIVVCDRYTLSSLVYQSLTAPQGQAVLPWIAALNERAILPDACIVLQVPAAEAAKRRHSRGGAEELFEGKTLQERLADGYARAGEFAPGQPLSWVDGVGEPERVTEQLLACLVERFPELGGY